MGTRALKCTSPVGQMSNCTSISKVVFQLILCFFDRLPRDSNYVRHSIRLDKRTSSYLWLNDL
jgi:hypothetical protein